MTTELTLKERNEFDLDVFNSDFDHLFMISGSLEIERDGVTYCLISSVRDSNDELLPNFITKEWVISVIESKDEVQEMVANLQPYEEDYTEEQSTAGYENITRRFYELG